MTDPARPGPDPSEFPRNIPLARLPRSAPHDFDETATAEERAALVDLLGLTALRKLRIHGTLTPVDAQNWQLDATLGATVVQPCVATLAPVQTRIDVPVRRTYLAEAEDLLLSEELEIDADTPDEVEPLPRVLDLGALATGELALALPAYPRAADAPVAADRLEDVAAPAEKPFAALASLRKKLDDGENGG